MSQQLLPGSATRQGDPPIPAAPRAPVRGRLAPQHGQFLERGLQGGSPSPPGRRRLARAPRTVGAGWRQAALGSRTSVRGEGGPRGGPGQRSTCCARARVPPHFTRPPGLRDRPGAPERAARRRRLPGQSGPSGRPPPTCVSSPGRLSSAGPIGRNAPENLPARRGQGRCAAPRRLAGRGCRAWAEHSRAPHRPSESRRVQLSPADAARPGAATGAPRGLRAPLHARLGAG